VITNTIQGYTTNFFDKINNNMVVNAFKAIHKGGNLEECVSDSVQVETIYYKYVLNSEWKRASVTRR